MIEIKPKKIEDQEVTVPGSKSYSHRFLIAASLSKGLCTIENLLDSEDTRLTKETLGKMGVVFEEDKDILSVHGTSGLLQPCDSDIYLGNSGTSMRLLTAVAAIGQGVYTLTGTQRMQDRPIQDLLDALDQIGVVAGSVKKNGCPPVQIHGSTIKGGKVVINCKSSSQFLSALLLIGPYTKDGLDIIVSEGPVSRPYIDITLEVMKIFGIDVLKKGYTSFQVPGNQIYNPGNYTVEPDCSQAGYFWAAAAITGACIKVKGTTKNSRQGDMGFLKVLTQMGCDIIEQEDGISVKGGSLRAIKTNMEHMPDLVPTLAIVAAFAKGTTIISNVAHLKIKECDRLTATATELTKLGIFAKCTENELVIQGGNPHGAVIDTYKDHRMAMTFALAGLKVPGIHIKGEGCVEKSFPNFWQVFQGMK